MQCPTAHAELPGMLGGNITLRPDETGIVAEVPLSAMNNLLNPKDNIRIGSGGGRSRHCLYVELR